MNVDKYIRDEIKSEVVSKWDIESRPKS
jgi:hypothetical protein